MIQAENMLSAAGSDPFGSQEGLRVSSHPLVTVVMPVRNEASFIERSVGSVLAQDYPINRLEILVVEGCSTDGTREILASLERKHERLHVLDNAKGIVATGLNTALQRACGDILVRVDGHCEIAPDYVRRCVAHLLAGEAEGVGGPVETVGENFLARVIAGAMSSRFGVGGAQFRTVKDRSLLVDTVAFPAYTRETLERGGPFDEELVRNQDDEYNYRLRGIGARILLASDVLSRYYSRSSLRSLWRQYFQYGFWKVRVLQKHPAQMKARQFVPPLFVSALLLSIGVAPFNTAARMLLLGVMAAYAVANLAASVFEVRRLGVRSLLVLPAVFAILHAAYGLGFLKGLAHFWNRWGDRRTRCAGAGEEAHTPVLRPDASGVKGGEAEEVLRAESAMTGHRADRSAEALAAAAERQRLLAEYRRRAEVISSDRYAAWQPSQLFIRMGRNRTAIRMLAEAGAFPRAGDPCLEVGFGSLGWLGELLCWGLRETDLHGIELDAARAARAQEILPEADLRVGDATSLPWEDGRFRLVVCSTVFTSVLDANVRRMVAREIRRVLAPGGALLWYDFAVNNPRNPNVRKVDRTELRELFPSLEGRIRSVTLAPPLTRLVAPRSWLLATVLEMVPVLRTHLLAVLVKRP